jgi:soluble lytic murein transglycosylase-like protein
MRLPLDLNSCSALSLLLLAIAPALHAGERAPQAPSPYQLAIGTADSGSAANSAAPYQLDQRYRLEQQQAELVAEKLPDKPYARQIDAAARDAGLDPALVHAVVSVESAYQSSAVSPKGAVGLMQVLPETALRYGVTQPR